MTTDEAPKPHARTSRYTVSILDPSDTNYRYYSIQVVWLSGEHWTVEHLGDRLDANGDPGYQEYRDEQWWENRRFTLQTALDLAMKFAPGLECNGLTATDRWHKNRADTPANEPAPAVA